VVITVQQHLNAMNKRLLQTLIASSLVHDYNTKASCSQGCFSATVLLDLFPPRVAEGFRVRRGSVRILMVLRYNRRHRVFRTIAYCSKESGNDVQRA
jgi:hypothetical protein